MLILSRKVGESIVIDGRIKVKVVGREGGEIRLGIQAPDDVWILRGELVGDPGKLPPTEGQPGPR